VAGEVNTGMPEYVVNRAAAALNAARKSVNGSSVLIVGLAYKADVDDDRESPSYVLMNLFQERGAKLAYYDPYVPVIKPTREHPHWAGMKSVAWDAPTIRSFDLVVIATRHQSVNYNELAEWADCVVDTRNAMASVKTRKGQVFKA
jgi:UDP-N-acetyl-D-glucosamine dehydrogenase